MGRVYTYADCALSHFAFPNSITYRDVHFLSAMTLAPYSTAYCRGRHGPLHSLAWDSLAPQVLHASTAHGDLLSFDTSPPHARRGQSHQQQQMYGGAAVEGNCALVKKLASRTGGKGGAEMRLYIRSSAFPQTGIVIVVIQTNLITSLFQFPKTTHHATHKVSRPFLSPPCLAGTCWLSPCVGTSSRTTPLDCATLPRPCRWSFI
jgi:hypothetical protein